jgi:hypothetical protein
VQLSRVKDEFLFTIESTGILSPEELFKEALKVLHHPRPLFLNCGPSQFVQGAAKQMHGGGGRVAGGGEGSVMSSIVMNVLESLSCCICAHCAGSKLAFIVQYFCPHGPKTKPRRPRAFFLVKST